MTATSVPQHMTRSVTGESLERDKHLINCPLLEPRSPSVGFRSIRGEDVGSSVIVTGDGSCSKAFFLFDIDGMCFNFLLSSVHVYLYIEGFFSNPLKCSF